LTREAEFFIGSWLVDNSQIVEVYAARDAVEAHAIRNELGHAEIEARVVGDMLRWVAGELPFGHHTAPRVWVREEDEERAREIIRRLSAGPPFQWDHTEQIEDEAVTDSGDAIASRAWRAAMLGISFLPVLLSFYSIWLLAKLARDRLPVSPAANWRVNAALFVNACVITVLIVIGLAFYIALPFL